MIVRACFLSIFLSLMILAKANALHPNLMAAWTFDEGEGSTTADITGNGHDATLVGSPSWQEGRNGMGIRIVGTTQYAYARDADDLHFEDMDFTFTAWINIRRFVEDQACGILSKRVMQATDNCPTLLWVIGKDARQLELQMRDDQSKISILTANRQMEEKEWYHVAVVKDIRNVTFYLNGKHDAKIQHDFRGSFTSREPLYIGVHHYSSKWNCPLSGTIDEVGIFNKALTAPEITAIMPSIEAGETYGKLTTTWGSIKSSYWTVQ